MEYEDELAKISKEHEQDRQIRDLRADLDQQRSTVIETLAGLKADIRVLGTKFDSLVEARTMEIQHTESEKKSIRNWAIAVLVAGLAFASVLLTIGDARVKAVEQQIAQQAKSAATIHETLTAIVQRNSEDIDELQSLHRRNAERKESNK